MPRHHKGDRELIRQKLPVPLVEAMRAQAGELGLNLTDYIGYLAASATGVPYTTGDRVPQERLPMTA